MGRWHADAVRRVGGKVVIVADPDIVRAGKLAAESSGARATTRPSDSFARGVVDVVHLCTPVEERYPLATETLAAGLHLLAEKPLAASAAMCRELHSLARSKGVLLCPVHQFLYQTGVLRAAGSLEAIGPLRHFEAVTCSAGASGQDARALDRLAFDILPHPLALAARLLPGGLGDPRFIARRAAPGEIQVMGASRDVNLSILVSARGRPTRNSFRIIGERGTIHGDLFHGFSIVEGGRVSRVRKVIGPFALSASTLIAAGTNLAARAARTEPAFPGLREIIARFYAAVRDNGEAPITERESLEVATSRDTIIAALHVDGSPA